MPLSVPSSSGKGLQPIQYGFLVISCITFSPLFIGEGSSTFSGPAVLLSLLEHFQSPLHRGRVFNRDTADCTSRLTDTFSPLFIGEGSSTENGVADGKSFDAFQSPLHRGRVFNQSPFLFSLSPNYSFSPLFIGEGSSTARQLSFWKTRRKTFSPLFIGEGSSTGDQRRDTSRQPSFQSPLHRGRVFNLDYSLILLPGFYSFSPLFIGEGSSTAL